MGGSGRRGGGFGARWAVVGVALGVSLALAGCGLGRGTVIDTWPIGEPAPCDEIGRCDELVAAGLEGIDARDPGHAPVVSTAVHLQAPFIDPVTGQEELRDRSGGCCYVVVARLLDGSARAIGVGWPGISPVAVAIPWAN